eukprot:2722009-Alexandrium_andersonii.AAC.1
MEAMDASDMFADVTNSTPLPIDDSVDSAESVVYPRREARCLLGMRNRASDFRQCSNGGQAVELGPR